MAQYPKKISHWIGGKKTLSKSKASFDVKSPHDGRTISSAARGNKAAVSDAVKESLNAHDEWSRANVVDRAKILRKVSDLLISKKAEFGKVVALETGKSQKGGAGAVGSAAEHAYFWSGEGRRFYSRVLTSKTPGKLVYTKRESAGVAGVISPANSPFGARSIFPALLCGNTVVLKPSERAPYTALLLAEVLKEAGIPRGVFNVVQGIGSEAGSALVEHKDVSLLSFTGSAAAGRDIQERVAKRRFGFPKVSLELGGKNALVVSDDADIGIAVQSAVSSAFGDAGQRCAAAGRIIVFDSIYESFKEKFIRAAQKYKIGVGDNDNIGPLISEEQLDSALKAVGESVRRGAKLLYGGGRPKGKKYRGGYYMTPTILKGAEKNDPIHDKELFAPVALLYKVKNIDAALRLVNNSPYGLTSAIHTRDISKGLFFAERAETGVVNINGSTFGSEQHMPFGGLKNSGNGWREGGVEALDFYANTKTVSITYRI